MSIYYIPALVGLVSKIFILRYAYKNQGVSKKTPTLMALISVFACHNAIELVGYIQFLDNQTVAALFRAYYVATVIGLFLIALHAFYIAGLNDHVVGPILAVITISLSVAIMLSDAVISGGYSIGYSMTATKGEYYFVFSLFSLLVTIATPALLIYGYKTASNDLDSVRSVYSLFALLPLLLISLVVLILKTFDIGINLAGVIPIATTLFLFVMLKGESKHQLTDIRRLLPFSKERKAARALLRLTDSYSQDIDGRKSFSQLRQDMEREIILYTLEKCDNNVTKAAEMMGLPNRSSLYSMMKRLDIKSSE